MKVFAVLAFFAIVAYASAASVPQFVYDGPLVDDTDNGFNTDDGFSTNEEFRATKPRRVICNLSHFNLQWMSVNQPTCAALCVDQRYSGGHCSEGICVCRNKQSTYRAV